MKIWTIDPAHSEISFKVKHLMVSTVRGIFSGFEGSISADDDSFANANISFSADVSTISTQNAQRDGHLVSADFFDAAAFPKATFVSTTFSKNGDQLEITGDLTIKGITKSETLHGSFNGIAVGLDGKRVAAFEVATKINRADFGLTWNAALDAGGVAVSDSVAIEATIEVKEA